MQQQDVPHWDNPLTVYNIATREAAAVIASYEGQTDISMCPPPDATFSIVDDDEHMFTPTPAEEARMKRFATAIAVPRAVYMAALQIDPTTTASVIERKWLMPKSIARARDMQGNFIRRMIRHERFNEGFIAKHIVLSRDLHKLSVRTLLTRATALVTLHDRVLLMRRGDCIGIHTYARAYDELIMAL
jgi:hypothetical protein